MMLCVAAAVLWLWLLLLSPAAGHYTAECTTPGPPAGTVSLLDSPPGRVVVRYCAPADESVSLWHLEQNTLKDVQRANCSYEHLGEYHHGEYHSISEERVRLDLNCTNVCFSRTLDLVYRGCYRLQNRLMRDQHSIQPTTTYYYSNSIVLDYTNYTNAPQPYRVDPLFGNEKKVVLRWFQVQGAIPIEEFTVTLQSNNTNEDRMEVTSNCSRHPNFVRCELSIAPGCYTAYFTHRAPWTSSRLFESKVTSHAEFCHKIESPPSIHAQSSTLGTVTWSLVGLLLLLAVSTVGALLWRFRTRRWLEFMKPRLPVHSTTPSTEVPSQVTSLVAPSIRILLLYARECAAGARVANRLRELLHTVAKDQVYDLYSAETVALAAAAPSEWVRDMMTSPHTRVVLLQTPALACMYRVTTTPTTPDSQLCSPLLGNGAVYATPMFGDSLLALALRLLTEGPPQPLPYLTYYLATLEELHTEALPHVVPFRRYELPCASRRLLADLSSSSLITDDDDDLHDKLTAFSGAVGELVEYVRNNQNYLADELMFL